MTAASKSKRRRRAAIGDDAVIPAKAGIQAVAAASKSKRRKRAAIGDDAVIPAKAGIQAVAAASKSQRRRRAVIGNDAVISAKAGIQAVAAASRSQRRSRAAIGDGAVIPVARSADRDPIAGHRNFGPGLRRGDEAHAGTPSHRVLRGFPPIIDRATETLILGSFPSEASLAARQYYAHPRNQFWRLLGALLDEPLAELAYAERGARVLAHRIGIWDVLGACRRPGSLDADISDARPNDFALLRRRAPALRRVLFNGAAAGRYAAQFIAAGFTTGILPSSSPAHAARSCEQKLALWRAGFAAPAAA